MQLTTNPKKNLEITVDGNVYERGAIKTHFVNIKEDYIKLVEDYVLPYYQEGDVVSISEKIIALCQERIVTREQMKPSKLALFLYKFARPSSAGPGVHNPYKMQFAIYINGPIKVIYAAIMGGIGKFLGKKGVFYDIVGPEITGLDGFYGDEFEEYAEYGIRIPENPTEVCNEIFEKTGVKTLIGDINDLTATVLGKCDNIGYTDEELCAILKDNPAGQSTECTPFILIRKK